MDGIPQITMAIYVGNADSIAILAVPAIRSLPEMRSALNTVARLSSGCGTCKKRKLSPASVASIVGAGLANAASHGKGEFIRTAISEWKQLSGEVKVRMGPASLDLKP